MALEKDSFVYTGRTKDCLEQLKNHLPQRFSKIFVLVDKNTERHCFPFVKDFFQKLEPCDLIDIVPGEASKSLYVVEDIWKTLKNNYADRYSVIVNLGGGVITDLGGFVASTFMRGIPFFNMPTSLLAMVDAAIGGKNGIDFDGAKNIIGCINNADGVLINTDFLKTLPQREILCGWAEMLKHALINDAVEFEKLAEIENPTKYDILPHITLSVEVKKDIVARDLNENGERKKLNFGHTIGHAIESYFIEQRGDKGILHGEAVAAGIIMAAWISKKHTGLSQVEYEKIVRTIDWIFPRIKFDRNDIDEIIQNLKFDKKAHSGRNMMVLLHSIGNAVIDIQVENKEIEEALNEYRKYA
jgi:3-dehydroquinate synthase